jgi:hypothetical protein
MSQYKFLVKLFRYTKRGGDEETIMFVRFDPSKPRFPAVYVEREVPDETG